VNNRSGWLVDVINNLSVHVANYDPIGGSCHVQTPRWISLKRAVINIENNDDKYFLYSVLAVSHPSASNDHLERVSNDTDYLEELKTEGLNFPLDIAQIPLFESKNTDYSINVYYPNSVNKRIVPLYVSAHRGCKYEVDLLLLCEGDRWHYVVIPSLSRLVAGRITWKKKSYPCRYCLHCFTTEDCLNRHIPECIIHGHQNVQYPTPGYDILKFRNYQNRMKVPFVLYSDFEALLQKSDTTTSTQLNLSIPMFPAASVASPYHPSPKLI